MLESELYTIEWRQNPLDSCVKLTDVGRLRLKFGIAIDLIEEAASIIHLINKEKDVKWARQFIVTDDVASLINKQAVLMESWLLETHCGDCTCVPTTCLKCLAEDMLGVSVREGLGKHEGHAIQKTFAEYNTLDEVINSLETALIVPTWGTAKDWEPYMGRWREERDKAAAWLKQYKADHFS